MINSQYPYSLFDREYFIRAETIRAQQEAWQQEQQRLAQQEWNEQQEHIAKACHALSDFLHEPNQIKPAYQVWATLVFFAAMEQNHPTNMV